MKICYHMIDSFDQKGVYCECGHLSSDFSAHSAHQREVRLEVSRTSSERGLYEIHCHRTKNQGYKGKIPRRQGRE